MLNSTGAISLGGSVTGQSVNLELGVSPSATRRLGDPEVRGLAVKPSGLISLSDLYGKSKPAPLNTGNGYLPFQLTLRKLSFVTEVSYTLSAQVAESHYYSATVGSVSKGFICGGGGYLPIAVIEKLTYSSDAYVTTGAVLPQGRTDAGGVNSSTKGYIAGGGYGSYVVSARDTVFTLDFAAETVATMGAALPSAARFCSTYSSLAKGYILPVLYTGATFGVVFASDSTTTLSSVLPAIRKLPAGNVVNEFRGYSAGGEEVQEQFGYNDITSLEFSTEAISVRSAAISATRHRGTGVNSRVAGFFCGGYVPVSNPLTTTVDKIAFATETMTANSAGLHAVSGYNPGLSCLT